MAEKYRQSRCPFFFFFSGEGLPVPFPVTTGPYDCWGRPGWVAVGKGYTLGITILPEVSMVGRKTHRKGARKHAKKLKLVNSCHRQALAAAWAGGNGSGTSRGGFRRDVSGKSSLLSLSPPGIFFFLSSLFSFDTFSPGGSVGSSQLRLVSLSLSLSRFFHIQDFKRGEGGGGIYRGGLLEEGARRVFIFILEVDMGERWAR